MGKYDKRIEEYNKIIDDCKLELKISHYSSCSVDYEKMIEDYKKVRDELIIVNNFPEK